LYQLACGYERDAIRIINGNMVRYREHVPGDVAAQCKWLAARRPDLWGKNPDTSEIKREKTFEEARDDLIQFLVEECGVLIEPNEQIDKDSTVSRIAASDERGDKDERQESRETRGEPLPPGMKPPPASK
jgi:hypothetical protein